MSRAALRITGCFGLAWGVLALIAYILAFFAASGALSGIGVTLVVALSGLATLALGVMLFFLSKLMTNAIGKIACYAASIAVLLMLVQQFVPFAGNTATVVVLVLLGLGMVVIGALGATQRGGRAWKTFAVLFLFAGL